ncbi:MAG: glycosyltransferase [Caldilineaceae bacterium]
MLLAVGRMVYKKGFDDLLCALADPALDRRAVVAVMVGDGDQRAAWEQLAADLGVAAQVRWVGTVPKDRIGVYYNAADVLVMPSVSKPADGLNVCVLDAMSCAKPVVGTDVAGNPLAVVDGVTGRLVPEQDPAALAAALAELVADPHQRGHGSRQAPHRNRVGLAPSRPPLHRPLRTHARGTGGCTWQARVDRSGITPPHTWPTITTNACHHGRAGLCRLESGAVSWISVQK